MMSNVRSSLTRPAAGLPPARGMKRDCNASRVTGSLPSRVGCSEATGFACQPNPAQTRFPSAGDGC